MTGYPKSEPIATDAWDQQDGEESVVLMVVNAAFTSIGLNYFSAVVPKVDEFERFFVKTGKITGLEDLVAAELLELQRAWKNKRSWEVAKAIAAYLSFLRKKEGISERGPYPVGKKHRPEEMEEGPHRQHQGRRD